MICPNCKSKEWVKLFWESEDGTELNEYMCENKGCYHFWNDL